MRVTVGVLMEEEEAAAAAAGCVVGAVVAGVDGADVEVEGGGESISGTNAWEGPCASSVVSAVDDCSSGAGVISA